MNWKKGVIFKWESRHEKAFQEIIQLFPKEMTLAYPDVNKPYYLTTDASNYALSAILSQIDDAGIGRVILCISRSMKGAKLNYFITEKEMLSIVRALKNSRVYLFGAVVNVRADHKARTFFNKCRFANDRLMRWILAIQDYYINFEYLKEKNNGTADFFSRNVEDFGSTRNKSEISIMNVLLEKPDRKLMNDLKNIRDLQKRDEHVGKIYNNVNSEIYAKNYVLRNDILRKKAKFKGKIVLPDI